MAVVRRKQGPSLTAVRWDALPATLTAITAFVGADRVAVTTANVLLIRIGDVEVTVRQQQVLYALSGDWVVALGGTNYAVLSNADLLATFDIITP